MNTTTDTQEDIRSAVEQLLAAMCEQPAAASVHLMPSPRKPALILNCHRMDFGAILGKHGSMLAAIKTLATAIGNRHGLEVVTILDEDGCTGNAMPRRRYEHNPEWDAEPFEKLACIFCAELADCVTSVEPVGSSMSKLTVTFTGPMENTADVEQALEKVFSCVGVVQGRRIIVEVVPA